MIRLLGLKKELQHVDYMNDLGKTYHILFNKYYNTFLASPMNLGICMNSKSIENGWVDITELCEWYGRKVNYSNCRMYALRILEHETPIIAHIEVYNEVILSYENVDNDIIDSIEKEEINTTVDVKTNCINDIYGEIIGKCESSNYGYFAIRQEDCLYDPGDWAFNSKTLLQDPEYDDNGELIYPLCSEGPYKGFYVGPMLPGTSGIMFYDYETFKTAIKELNYSGDKITIIGGDTFEYGDDINEVIIHNARVIAQYQKEECLCIE